MYEDIVSLIQESGIILNKPLVFFDLETTGLELKTDRIVEISAIKIYPDYSVDDLYYKINPQIPIPKEASDIHGITNEDVKECPMFAGVAEVIFNFFNDADLGGYNIRKFDIALLIEEFNRVGKQFKYSNKKIVDGLSVYHKMEPRDLGHTLEYFTGETLEDAHSAQADNIAALKVAIAEMKKYGFTSFDEMHDCATEETIDLIGFFTRNADRDIVFRTGKHRGEKVLDVSNSDPSYIGWIKKDCIQDVQRHLAAILSGKEI